MGLNINIPALRRVRRHVLRKEQTRFAVLGDGNGKVHDTETKGKVWVRFPGGTDSSGNTAFLPPVKVNSGVGANYIPYEGAGVRVGVGDNGELEVKRADWRDMIAAGLNPSITNPSLPEHKILRMADVQLFMSRPVGQTVAPSTYVNLRSLFYVDGAGELQHYPGAAPASGTGINLNQYIPSLGEHRIAIVYISAIDNTAYVAASTSKSISSALTSADYQEAVDNAEPEPIWSQGYKLSNAQGNVTSDDIGLDLRQWINTSYALGIENPVVHKHYLRGSHQLLCFDLTVQADLTVVGELTVL